MKFLLQFGLRMYQRFLSPMLPHSCRFVPTCSEYAMDAIERYGALRGSWLAMGRLLRCHPFARAGYDPVPPGPSQQDFSEEVFRAAKESSSHAF
jgi:putative membrane protein insertion efficiency factor